LVTTPSKPSGTYDVSVIRGDSATATLPSGITYSVGILWTSGKNSSDTNLGNVIEGIPFSIPIVATSDSTITYANISALPPETTLNSLTGNLEGNITSVTNDTLYSFDIKATDLEFQDATRTFLLYYFLALEITAAQYTSSSWTPLVQTALDSNSSNVWFTISGSAFKDDTTVTVDGTPAVSVVVDSPSLLKVQAPSKPRGTYDVVVDTGSSQRTLSNGVTYSDVPSWTTATDLGNVIQGIPFSIPIVATSDSTITYANISALPPETTLNSLTGNLEGNITSVTNDTLYSFDVKATDLEFQDATRTFLLHYFLALEVTAAQYTSSSWTPLTQTALDSNSSNVWFTIVGEGFKEGISVTVDGTPAVSVVVDSPTLLKVQAPSKPRGTYDVVVTSGTQQKTFANGVTYSDVPTWTTGTNLGTVYYGQAFSFTLSTTSDSAVSYSNTTSLPPSTVLSNGIVSGSITGSSSATYSFSVKATDQELQSAIRSFSLQYIAAPAYPVSLLDASASVSWPGTGSTWYDISGNGRHGTWNNVSTGTYNGKTYFSTNSGSYVCTGPASNSFGITSTSGYTIFMVYKAISSSGNFALFFDGSSGREISVHLPWNDGTIYFDQGGCCEANQRTQWTISPTNTVYNTWHSVALVRSSGSTNSRSIYYDGSLKTTNSTNGAALNFNSNQMRYVNQTVSWPAHVMCVAIYNRGLSSAEISTLHTIYYPG